MIYTIDIHKEKMIKGLSFNKKSIISYGLAVELLYYFMKSGNTSLDYIQYNVVNDLGDHLVKCESDGTIDSIFVNPEHLSQFMSEIKDSILISENEPCIRTNPLFDDWVMYAVTTDLNTPAEQLLKKELGGYIQTYNVIKKRITLKEGWYKFSNIESELEDGYIRLNLKDVYFNTDMFKKHGIRKLINMLYWSLPVVFSDDIKSVINPDSSPCDIVVTKDYTISCYSQLESLNSHFGKGHFDFSYRMDNPYMIRRLQTQKSVLNYLSNDKTGTYQIYNLYVDDVNKFIDKDTKINDYKVFF